jgi:hypothetical protein
MESVTVYSVGQLPNSCLRIDVCLCKIFENIIENLLCLASVLEEGYATRSEETKISS